MKFSNENMSSLYVEGQVYRLSSEMGVRIYVCLQVHNYRIRKDLIGFVLVKSGLE